MIDYDRGGTPIVATDADVNTEAARGSIYAAGRHGGARESAAKIRDATASEESLTRADMRRPMARSEVRVDRLEAYALEITPTLHDMRELELLYGPGFFAAHDAVERKCTRRHDERRRLFG